MAPLLFLLALVFLGTRVFFSRNHLRELVPFLVASIIAKFAGTNSIRPSLNILKQSFKGHKNSE